MAKCEFFIAYATPDERAAKQLKWRLGDKQRQAFVDKSGIKPGSNWDRELLDELNNAQVVIVLASSSTRQAHYQRDEIARVVRNVRQGRQQVVPVLLDGIDNADLPYGLMNFQSLDASRDGGMERVADELDELFPKLQASPVQARGVWDDFGAALRLNRVRQWLGVLEGAQAAGNVLFLYHGSHDQNVQLFIERIRRFFSAEAQQSRTLCRVPFKIQGATPQTGMDWVGHMRAGLGCENVPLAECLAAEIAKQPLFVILGLRPMPAGQLTNTQKSALREFVTEELPATLRQANIQGGLAMLLPFDYLTDDPPELIAEIQGWGRSAQETGWLRFRALPRASLPSWTEVVDYLTELDPPTPQDQIELIKCEYDQRIRNPDLSFDDLARIVDSFTQNV
jgi:hypothetical protein